MPKDNKHLLYFCFVGLVCLFLSSCSTAPVAKSPVDAAIYGSSSTPFAARAGVYHSIAPGETLWRISKMYDVDVQSIVNANRIKDVTDVEIGQKIYVPNAARRKNIISLYPNRKWKYIIIHHSATDFGNAMQFNEAHLRRGWKGIGYHFIIDNGTCGKDDGQIEMGPRWIKQQDGAHCKANNMNERAIGICLVGNFSKGKPTKKQMDSLIYLTDKLKKYYKISKKRVLGHGEVLGAKTECPGTRFSMRALRSRLD